MMGARYCCWWYVEGTNIIDHYWTLKFKAHHFLPESMSCKCLQTVDSILLLVWRSGTALFHILDNGDGEAWVSATAETSSHSVSTPGRKWVYRAHAWKVQTWWDIAWFSSAWDDGPDLSTSYTFFGTWIFSYHLSSAHRSFCLNLFSFWHFTLTWTKSAHMCLDRRVCTGYLHSISREDRIIILVSERAEWKMQRFRHLRWLGAKPFKKIQYICKFIIYIFSRMQV